MPIKKQLEYFRENASELAKKYDGKYLVISENLEEKAFDTLDEAYIFGMNNLGAGNFMLKLLRSNVTRIQIINQTITSL